MNQHKFQPVQEPQPEELNGSLIDSMLNLAYRFPLMLQPGILPATKMYAVTGDARFQQIGEFSLSVAGATGDGLFRLNVGPGIAFSRNPVNDPTEEAYDSYNSTDLKMERIFINPATLHNYDAAAPSSVDSLGNALPRSTGSQNIELNPIINGSRLPLTYYHVYVAYLPVVDSGTTPGGDPINNYTINPHNGKVEYTHWIDGYQVKLFQATSMTTGFSTDADDVYLGTVICTNAGITGMDTARRQYAYTPSTLVKSPLHGSFMPPAYTYGTTGTVSVTDHINSVGDPALVTVANPHGIRLADIVGATGLSPYTSFPEIFHANGIVDTANAIPGPFFAQDQATPPAYTTRCAMLTRPAGSQLLMLYGASYNSTANVWCETISGSTLVDEQRLDNLSLPTMFAEFSPVRTAGRYIVYVDKKTDPTYPGIIARAVGFGYTKTLAELVRNPSAYLTGVQYPVAVVDWNGNSFASVVDPDTGANTTMVDVRAFGTIGTAQLSNGRRCVTGSTMASLPEVAVHNNLRVDGSVTGATFYGDGSELTNVNKHAHAQNTSGYVAVNLPANSWTNLANSVSITTRGSSAIFMTFTTFATAGAGAYFTNYFTLVVDGARLGSPTTGLMNYYMQPNGMTATITYVMPVTAGAHTIGVACRNPHLSNAYAMIMQSAVLSVVEV